MGWGLWSSTSTFYRQGRYRCICKKGLQYMKFVWDPWMAVAYGLSIDLTKLDMPCWVAGVGHCRFDLYRLLPVDPVPAGCASPKGLLSSMCSRVLDTCSPATAASGPSKIQCRIVANSFESNFIIEITPDVQFHHQMVRWPCFWWSCWRSRGRQMVLVGMVLPQRSLFQTPCWRTWFVNYLNRSGRAW